MFNKLIGGILGGLTEEKLKRQIEELTRKSGKVVKKLKRLRRTFGTFSPVREFTQLRSGVLMKTMKTKHKKVKIIPFHLPDGKQCIACGRTRWKTVNKLKKVFQCRFCGNVDIDGQVS